jgi:5-methylcytosine-specific restriction endonuclease McrA
LKEAVIERDGGKYQICGKPGTDIDHIDGDSNDLNKLQLLCRECHNKKTISHMIQIVSEDERYWIVKENQYN